MKVLVGVISTSRLSLSSTVVVLLSFVLSRTIPNLFWNSGKTKFLRLDLEFLYACKNIKGFVLLFYSLAICGFIFPGMVNTHQQKYFEGMDVRQSKKALKKALISLKNGGENEFNISASVLYIYLKEKFYLQTDKMDPTTVQTILEKYIPEQEMNELIQLLYR